MEQVHHQSSSDSIVTILIPTDFLTVKVVAEEPYNSQTARINCQITLVLHISQPWASHLDCDYQQSATSMVLHSTPSKKKVPHVLALIPGSNNVHEGA